MKKFIKYIMGITIFVLVLSACEFITGIKDEVSTTGAISGVVKDKSNESPIDSAKVTILNNERNYKYTDKNGKFTFINIESGNYTFVITKSNYIDLTEKQVFINANDTINRDFFMIQKDGEVVKKLELSTYNLNYGEQYCNYNESKAFTIKNIGNTTVAITDIEFPNGFSTASNVSFELDSGKTVPINVIFKPSSLGDYSGKIKIISNESSGTKIVNVSGIGKIKYGLKMKRDYTTETTVVQIFVSINGSEESGWKVIGYFGYNRNIIRTITHSGDKDIAFGYYTAQFDDVKAELYDPNGKLRMTLGWYWTKDCDGESDYKTITSW